VDCCLYIFTLTWGVVVLGVMSLLVGGANLGLLWGEDRGCLRGRFTRVKPLAKKARPVAPLDQDSDFSVRFRFQPLSWGRLREDLPGPVIGAVMYVGVHQSGADHNVDGAGVSIFWHSDEIGLAATSFVWGSSAHGEQSEDVIPVQYGTAYDVACEYCGSTKTMALSVFDATAAEQVGGTLMQQLPDDIRWSADQLAIWNCADGYEKDVQFTVFVDQLQYNEDVPLTFAGDLSELPIGDDGHFTWYQAPLPSLIAELQAPGEVAAGDDAQFVAVVQPGLSGQVTFALKTYAGELLWTETAPIADGQAAVVLASEAVARLEKGSRVLVATVNDEEERSAYAAVRLRGRVFRDVTGAPEDLQPGDEIVITDMSLLEPQGATSRHSEKGKWWRREYTVAGDEEPHFLVCVEERDMVDPDSCIAPQLTLSLDLEGWYEVWVRTYRYPKLESGAHGQRGIDVRLSGQRYFQWCDPLVDIDVVGYCDHGNLVDILYRAADVTGQHLLFQQPFGTYSSEARLCNAALAGVRLVKLSDEQVAQVRAERASTDNKITGYHDDKGTIMIWGAQNRDLVPRMIEPLRDHSGAFLSIELGDDAGLIIPTPYTRMFEYSTYHREYQCRNDAFTQWCFDNDINILDDLTDYAHQVNVKVFAHFCLSRVFNPTFLDEHPDWRVKRGRGTLDYANPEVHDYNVKKIAWIIANHDIDGFIVDYTRYGFFFAPEEPNKFEHMNNFLRKLRAAVNEVNAKKERKCLLAASFGDRSWHLTRWGPGDLTYQGLDVDTWIEEGLVDMLFPEGPTIIDFVEKAKGTGVRVWPRKVGRVTLSTHEWTPTDGPKEIEKEVKWTLDRGAEGIYFFNHLFDGTWANLRRLGFKDELELRTKTDEVYGFREGATADFATWYPNMEQRDSQRNTFKPLTIAADAERHVDGELLVPIRNSFDVPITADVSWIIPEGAAEQWTITPASGTVEIAPGEQAEVTFHLTGAAGSYEATPAPYLELSTDEEVVLRQQLTLRAVSQMTCRKVSSPPTTDGDLSDPAWAAAGGLQAQHLFPVGEATSVPRALSMAAAYDDENLYFAFDCTGVDASVHDNAGSYEPEKLQILVDAAGTEQEYLGFVVTPTGAQADFRCECFTFKGHFIQDEDWSAEWKVSAACREDGYTIEVAIPLAVFDAVPEHGVAWRFNAVLQAPGEDGSLVTGGWASPEAPMHLPRNYGTLHGALVFD